MILHPPFKISSRLLPAVDIDGCCIQLHYARQPGREGRTRYAWTIDLPNGGEFAGDDLQSGVGRHGLQEGFASLLTFLGAAGDSVNYEQRTGCEAEDSSLFPRPVCEWAADYTDEISMLQLEIGESETPLIEE